MPWFTVEKDQGIHYRKINEDKKKNKFLDFFHIPKIGEKIRRVLVQDFIILLAHASHIFCVFRILNVCRLCSLLSRNMKSLHFLALFLQRSIIPSYYYYSISKMRSSNPIIFHFCVIDMRKIFWVLCWNTLPSQV